mmetsp:Transcript_47334/g.122795  ORF Transcript_47334/g.122795 Transcript_47334/m.122795 type:complete len:220 (-) Transcript_47334:69-728(-)
MSDIARSNDSVPSNFLPPRFRFCMPSISLLAPPHLTRYAPSQVFGHVVSAGSQHFAWPLPFLTRSTYDPDSRLSPSGTASPVGLMTFRLMKSGLGPSLDSTSCIRRRRAAGNTPLTHSSSSKMSAYSSAAPSAWHLGESCTRFQADMCASPQPTLPTCPASKSVYRPGSSSSGQAWFLTASSALTPGETSTRSPGTPVVNSSTCLNLLRRSGRSGMLMT